MAVGLLAVTAPAMAADRGMGDPLGLINSGAVLPFVGAGNILDGSQSFLEVTSPVRDNLGLHMFFFATNCVKGPKSVGLSQTANDVDVFRIDNFDPDTGFNDGLLALASVSASGQALAPLESAIHARVYWVTADGFVRVLEPISLDHFEFPGQAVTWNPLRTGASFFAPLEANGFHTTLLLICPTQDIAGPTASGAAFPDDGLAPFPQLLPVPVGSAQATPLQARVYDDEERFLRDFLTSCECLTSTSVTALDAVYADPDPGFGAPFGTYTEIETTGIPTDSGNAFTGYKAIRVGGTAAQGGIDVFGRLDNANVFSQQGTRTFNTR
jgi:hypothetical protein